MKTRCKSGFEQDAIHARHVYKYTENAGVAKKAKRQINKRGRREAKKELEVPE